MIGKNDPEIIKQKPKTSKSQLLGAIGSMLSSSQVLSKNSIFPPPHTFSQNNYEELISNIEQDIQNIIKGKGEIDEKQIETKISQLETISHVPIVEQRLNRLRRLTKTLPKGSETDTTIHHIEISMWRLYIYELFKAIPEGTSNKEQLENQKREIIKFLRNNNFNINDIEGFLMKLLKESPELYTEILSQVENYHNELTTAKKAKKEEEQKNDRQNKAIQTLKKEKEKYRRHAEFKNLERKLNKNENLSPRELKQFLQIIEKHLDEIYHLQKNEPGKDRLEDRALYRLSNSFTNKQDGISELDQSKNQLQELKKEIELQLTKLSQDTYTQIEKRKEKIKEINEQFKTKLLSKENSNILKILEATTYEKQIAKRLELMMKAQKEGDNQQTQEAIKGMDELMEDYMKEYEAIRTSERTSPIQQREQMAKTYIRRRILDGFAELDKIRYLYGEIQFNNELKSFKDELLQEVQLKYNLGSEFDIINELDSENVDNTTQDKANEIFLRIQSQVNEVFQNYETSHSYIEEYKKENIVPPIIDKLNPPETQPNEFMNGLKKDITQAILASEGKIDNDINSDQELKNRIESLEKIINENKFDLVATPNGIAIVFQDRQEIERIITGRTGSATFAATLKNNPEIQKILNKENKNWTGNVIIVAGDRDDYELIHEVEHAISNGLRTQINQEMSDKTKTEEINPRLNEAVEELAIKFASGEIWDLLVLRKIFETENKGKAESIKYSTTLAALAYLKKESFGENETDILQKLHEILHIGLQITEDEVKEFKLQDDTDFMWRQNLHGEIIGNILTSYLDENGNYDLEAIIDNLHKYFEDYKYSLNKQNKENTDWLLYDDDKISEKDKKTYEQLADNKGFDFSTSPSTDNNDNSKFQKIGIAPSDFRSIHNAAFDAFADDKIGVERPKAVGAAAAAELPLFGWIQKAYGKKTAGPTEYHVGGLFGYDFMNRGYGGIVRGGYNLPIVGGLIRSLFPPNMTKVSKPAKILNWLPITGKATELLMKESNNAFLKKLFKGIEQRFPGRPLPVEITKVRSSTLLAHELQNGPGILQEVFGFDQHQAANIYSQHPAFMVNKEGGQVKPSFSLYNLNKWNSNGETMRGTITESFIEATNNNPKFLIKDEIIAKAADNLAIRMNEAFKNARQKQNGEELYTIMDLNTAAQLAYDLGVGVERDYQGIAGDEWKGEYPVRNGYYDEYIKKWDRKHIQNIEVDGTRRSGIYVGKNIWYDTNDPTKRGIVIRIDGEPKCFSLDASTELIRRFNLFYMHKSLKEGVDKQTALMQKNNTYLPNINKRVKINDEEITNQRITIELQAIIQELNENKSITDKKTIPQIALEQLNKTYSDFIYIFLDQQQGTLVIKSKNPKKYAIYENEEDGIIYLCETKKDESGNPIVNEYHMDSMYAFGVHGMEGNEALADQWLTRASMDRGSFEEGVIDEQKLLHKFLGFYNVVAQYERKGYYASTIWGELNKWLFKRWGNWIMGGSLLGVALTASPLLAGVFVGGILTRRIFTPQIKYQEAKFKARRFKALDVKAKLDSTMQQYLQLGEGKANRPMRIGILENTLNGIEAMVEDVGKAEPDKGQFPEDDWGVSLFNQFLGPKGMIPGLLGAGGGGK